MAWLVEMRAQRLAAKPERSESKHRTFFRQSAFFIEPYRATRYSSLLPFPIFHGPVQRFRQAPRLPVRIGAVALGVLIGFALWGGFTAGVEATNSTAFCTGCQEMRDNVYEEYKSTVHYNNRTGVRAGCSDCHVPKEWTHKLVRKIKASGELWGHLTGSIDTKEKFEARRMELATNEWKRMEASGSRTCCRPNTSSPTSKAGAPRPLQYNGACLTERDARWTH